ncbi:hypothetical protein Ppa06_35390 [Planomonospora parontospora subsp. parontospora]|uniref:Uncharacterized protein n=2 Tax=Planomonospora parontospora TaxID=58119 RepID=A0AA37F523_9ACTN|nr:hypothetical protein [Planomonospora parontospora]GGK70927.1 hypothetical protein GCM10010126_33070 [Planomonospora parontospora]GII09741.1 hypothetical protein Ppa06_35390 [Planomonospora parontospora subsp. parontospora]
MKTEVYLSVFAEKQAETLRGADLGIFTGFVDWGGCVFGPAERRSSGREERSGFRP